MNNHENWGRLRKPILVLGLVLVLVGLVDYFAEAYRSSQEAALAVQKNLLNQARQKLLLSGQEREMIAYYLPSYQHLIAAGLIGEEQRIEWIENIRKIHQQNKLFSIEYNIGQQEKILPTYIPNLGNFTMHRSVMKLKMGLLHELDLLTLLDGLREQSSPFIVRECEMTKQIGAVINPQTLSNNIHASCEIDWLTLRDPQLRAP
jgi:hypothetical protein